MQDNVVSTVLLDLLQKFVSAIPGVVGALVIFIVGWIVSNTLSKLISGVLQKIGIDKVSKKLENIDFIRKSNITISISVIIAKVVYYFVLIFFAVAAASVLGIPEVSNLITDIFNFIPNLIVAFIILIVGVLIADGVKGFVETTLKSLGIGSAGVIASAVFFFVLINVVISALSQAKIDTAFLAQNISIIIGGVVIAFALGYGLASKDVMANFIGSFYSKNLFTIGDKVTLNGVTGTIVDVTKSSLVIKTENSSVRFPLSKAISEKIEFHN